MLHIIILTPNEMLLDVDTESVTIPGTNGLFTVLDNHAPIISSLGKGKLICNTEEGVHEFQVNGGFVEVNDNVVSVCLE